MFLHGLDADAQFGRGLFVGFEKIPLPLSAAVNIQMR
jgi:hypothetical protein